MPLYVECQSEPIVTFFASWQPVLQQLKLADLSPLQHSVTEDIHHVAESCILAKCRRTHRL